MIINENGYNKVQINSTLDMDATGRIIKRSLMLNIREDDVNTACKLYEDLKRKIEGEEPKKRVKKEKSEKNEKIPENPICECGAPMILRMNGRGEKFYGCGAFPICRKTRPYQEVKEMPADQDLVDVKDIPF